MRLLYNPSNFDFFKHPDRCGETVDIQECIADVFDDIYKRLRNSSLDHAQKLCHYNELSEHPFIYKLFEVFSNPRTPDEQDKCDDIFAFYIFKVAKYARPEFFKRVLKFIMLFRECLNIVYEERNKSKKELMSYQYSQIFNCEDAPDISNEFVTDYLKADNCLFDFNRDEIIDLTQNFCQWLYDNNYTCSKLSLISSY